MNPVSRGIRNAFRNLTRTFSIIIILGLSIGLALTMLVAHQAVTSKINSVKASVGNTISVSPAGFSGFSSVNNSLTTSELAPITKLANVSSVTESFTARLSNSSSSTSSNSFAFPGQSSNSNATTNLNSPVTINTSSGGGRHFFFSAGQSGAAPTNFSLPISLLATDTPSSIDSANIKIVSGSLLNGNSNNNEAMISQSMANKNNLKVGSTFTAYSTTLTVAAIFTSSTQDASNTVVVSLPTGQTISGQAGDVTSATVYVNSIDNLSSVTSAVKSKLGSSADVTSSVEEANNTVAPLNSVKSISVYSLIGAVIAGAVIILLTMVMIVRERTREIGVIKAIGASNGKISFQFMSEAVTLTILGAVIGIVLAVVAASPITHTLVSNSVSSNSSATTSGGFGGPGGAGGGGTGPSVRSFGGGAARLATGGRGAGGFLKDNFTNIHAVVGWDTLGYGLLSAIVIALIGSAAVSYFIAKIRPAEVMRTE
jgi:putative ABC transport system permease protein